MIDDDNDVIKFDLTDFVKEVSNGCRLVVALPLATYIFMTCIKHDEITKKQALQHINYLIEFSGIDIEELKNEKYKLFESSKAIFDEVFKSASEEKFIESITKAEVAFTNEFEKDVKGEEE